MSRFGDFDIVFPPLVPLMSGCSANADLNYSLSEILFHNSGEWTCMRSRIALEILLDIGMRIEVEDPELRRSEEFSSLATPGI